MSKTVIQRSALLPYEARQMYALVNDIAAYPQFMEGCVGAEVLNDDGQVMLARLDLAKAGIRQSFTTRNEQRPVSGIIMRLHDGPFDEFSGEWLFESLGASACKVSLDLQFKLSGKVASSAVKRLFQSVSGNLVDALCKRANQLYGTK